MAIISYFPSINIMQTSWRHCRHLFLKRSSKPIMFTSTSCTSPQSINLWSRKSFQDAKIQPLLIPVPRGRNLAPQTCWHNSHLLSSTQVIANQSIFSCKSSQCIPSQAEKTLGRYQDDRKQEPINCKSLKHFSCRASDLM